MISQVKRSATASAVLVVAVVAILGTILALQGWKGRTPGFDSLVDIDGAHEFVQHLRLPEVSSLNSFAAYNPPGGSWLTLPGVLFFNDPRLFGTGSILLYAGTLIGILLLSRVLFGTPCALLAVIIYGVSELGLYVADSLWSRYPIHFFYVWMVYFAVQWVRKKNSWYLAGSLVTMAMGMNVFLEVAPAAFVLPALWWLYRPPLRIKPIVVAGILSAVVWYPYLRLEYGRNFSDLRITLARHHDKSADYKQAWCNPASTLVNLEGAPPSEAPPESPSNVPDAISMKILRHVLPLWERSHLVIEGIFSNFKLAARISGIDVLLGALLAITMSILLLSGISEPIDSIEKRCSLWLPRIGMSLIAASVLWNEFTVARFLSPHGFLQPSTISTIRLLQALLLVSGIVLITWSRKIAAFAQWIVSRMKTSANETASARILLTCLIVPWALLFAFIENSGRLDRLWWLWPLQCIVLAALVTYIPVRLGLPRIIGWVGSIVLIFLLGANSFLLSRVAAWHESGWSGSDPAEVQVVDYVATQIHGNSPTSIGYQIYIWQFMAIFNSSDPRYKVGADFDLLFRDRRGITNSNRCAEGISPVDEFRIVQVKPAWTDFRGKGYFDVPADSRFHFLRQFGMYQVFRRDGALARED